MRLARELRLFLSTLRFLKQVGTTGSLATRITARQLTGLGGGTGFWQAGFLHVRGPSIDMRRSSTYYATY